MNQVYLRALDLDDVDRIYQWHNDRTLYQSLESTFRYVSRVSVEEWLRRKQAYSVQEVNLAICLSDDSQHIGNIYLRDIDWPSRRAELHILIGDKNHQSKGYGEAALHLATQHSFKDLDLRRLYLFVLADNLRAIHVYEKCGFLLEGRLRKHAFKEGGLKDVLVMAISSDDIVDQASSSTLVGSYSVGD